MRRSAQFPLAQFVVRISASPLLTSQTLLFYSIVEWFIDTSGYALLMVEADKLYKTQGLIHFSYIPMKTPQPETS